MNSAIPRTFPRLTLAPLLACALLAGCGEDKPAAKAPPPAASKPAPPAEKPAAAPAAMADKPAPQAGALDPNRALAAAVKKALEAEPRVNGQGIDVTAKDGVVTLWGTVADADEVKLAAQIARGIAGVASVDSRLVVVKGS